MPEKKYKDMLLFLVGVFILPLISVYLQSITSNTMVQFILYGIEAAAPSLTTLLIMVKNKKVRCFLSHNFGKKGKLVTALILPVIFVFITMLIAKMTACILLKEKIVLCSISGTQWLIIFWALIAEEFGWRGYLQPFLYKQMKDTYLVPMIVGIIWGLWHYHYFIFGDMQVPLGWFFFSCIVESYIYSYLLNWTNQNLLSAMMYHFAWNLFVHIFALNPSDNMGNIVPYVILVIWETVICLVIHVYEKRRGDYND